MIIYLCSAIFAVLLDPISSFAFVGQFGRHEAFDKLAYLVDGEPLSSQTELHHRLLLPVLSRKGDFQPESTGMVLSQDQIFVEPELDVGQIAHIEDVDHLVGIFLGGKFEEVPVLAEGQDVEKGVHVRC